MHPDYPCTPDDLQAQQRSIERVRRNEGLELPFDLDYGSISSLSNEEVRSPPISADLRRPPPISADLPVSQVEKLSAARPRTLLEASEIDGVTPASLQFLLRAVTELRRGAAAAGGASKRRAHRRGVAGGGHSN